MPDFKFAVYEHNVVFEGNILRRQFIVLKDEDGNIVRWTDFHKYARAGKKSVAKSILSDSGKRCYSVVKLLNFVFFGKYHISRLTDITVEMVRDFLNAYGLCKLPEDTEKTFRNENTVKVCVSHIIDFIDLFVRDYPDCKIRLDQLYVKERVFDKRKRRYVVKIVPTFEVNYKPSDKVIYRDITDGAFIIILSQIMANHKNILMLAACSAFAGSRPSESCNVRRADSKLGPGIRFNIVDGDVEDVYIDLTKEIPLRSDLVNVGRIKKHRTAKVYPSFIEPFMDCYNVYMKYIEGKKYETDFGALTNTSSGKAYTYRNYYNKFQKVVKECIPIMLASDDPKTVNYGMLLQERNISPHILRHWFSMKLALYGEDVAGLMNWRGDKSPESALTYLQNKSELVKEYEKVSNEVFNYAFWRANKMFGGDKTND